MTLNFKPALDTYASNKTGALNAYRSAAHITARFRTPDDHHERMFRVPTPAHVARFLLVPAIERAGLTATSDIREAVHVGLNSVHRRYHGPLARRTSREGREHLDEAPPYLPLADYYAGLHAALWFTFDASHPDNSGVHFDRWDFEEAILAATFSELHTRAQEAAEKAARTVAREACEERQARPQPTPATLTDEQRARYRATAKAKRTAETDAHLQAVDDALADLIDRGELTPGASVTRAELTDMVRADLSPALRRALAPRRITALALTAAKSHGLAERVLSSTTDGKRTRTRGFVYAPQTIPEQPEETPVNINAIHAETAAVRELAAALREAREERDLFAEQTAVLRSGDTLGALQLQAERMHPAPVTDLDAYRARRAA